MSEGVCKAVIGTDGDSNWAAVVTIKHVCDDWPEDEITIPLPLEAISALHDYCAKTIADSVVDDTEEERKSTFSYVARHIFRIELVWGGVTKQPDVTNYPDVPDYKDFQRS